ncbi:hypothetical protein glysoja_045834 [Glycine soja]|uniref:Uncharacterized protein n=1 Tax=Glycine soja TaxID=3848 RepID=A0A0B2SHR3_GLYSO|nr:hypothetical protein glysoja_045834 [Glycine soja]
MDNVDAVDWGLKGSFVAVASKSVLSILSTKFEERVSISLSFRSWIGDFAADGSIKAVLDQGGRYKVNDFSEYSRDLDSAPLSKKYYKELQLFDCRLS